MSTLLLAEAGADVVAVEPPGGNAIRARAGFQTWMRSKRSVVLDLDQPDDRASLDDLLAAADVVVHNYGPTRARELGLDDQTLAARHPQLIVSSMLSWPANHPEADMPVDELLALARLGLLDEQQGYRDGPIFLRCPIGSWCASHLGAIGILARLIARERTGRAGPAHTSIAQGALVPTAMHWRQVEHPSPSLQIGMPKAQTGASLFESGDGVWLHLMGEPTKSPLFREAMAAGPPRGPTRRSERALRHVRRLARSAQVAPERRVVGDRSGPTTCPCNPRWPRARSSATSRPARTDYVVELDHPELGHIAMAGSPITVDPPTRVRNVAPDLGAHTAEVLDEWKPREHDRAGAATRRAALPVGRREGRRRRCVPRRAARTDAARPTSAPTW